MRRRGLSVDEMSAALSAIGLAVYLCGPDDLFDTGTKRKKRVRARRAHVKRLAAKRGGEPDISDLGADEVWEGLLMMYSNQARPTGHRAEKAAKVKGHAGAVRLDGELPAGVRQLLSKGVLKPEEGRVIGRFREDYLLAYYSTPGMVSRYGDSAGGGGSSTGGVAAARASVADARVRMDAIKARMSLGAWDVMVKMAVLDYTQLNVGGICARYADPKARRYAAGVLLMDGAVTLLEIYA